MAGGGSSKSHEMKKSSAQHLAERGQTRRSTGVAAKPGVIKLPNGSFGRIQMLPHGVAGQLGPYACGLWIGEHLVAGNVVNGLGDTIHPQSKHAEDWAGAKFVKL